MDLPLSTPRSPPRKASFNSKPSRSRSSGDVDSKRSRSDRSRSRSASPEVGRKRRGGKVGKYIEKQRRMERERWLQSRGGGMREDGEERESELQFTAGAERFTITTDHHNPPLHSPPPQSGNFGPDPGSVSFLGLHTVTNLPGVEYAKSETCATVGSEKSSVVDETDFASMGPPSNRLSDRERERQMSFSGPLPHASRSLSTSLDRRSSSSDRPPSEVLSSTLSLENLEALPSSCSPRSNSPSRKSIGVLGSDLSCGGSLREEEVSSNASTMKSRESKRSNVY
ncbi:hypothetical protein TrVE_jg7846 [Triparma verrucosa]|uniref:Uncharacterized protein n=1 Tax=Triparma verrucosa TaxID=1606542 RepID=A0A9W7BV51_9STRA|nr:hypothetical protein TrVE_jg7846 [Triparma verrucosa]